MMFENIDAAVARPTIPTGETLPSRKEWLAAVDNKIQQLLNESTVTANGSSARDHEQIANLHMWKGNVVDAVRSIGCVLSSHDAASSSSSSTLPSGTNVACRPEWVAMSAMCGMQQWTLMMSAMADNLEKKHDVHTAVSCWLCLGFVSYACRFCASYVACLLYFP